MGWCSVEETRFLVDVSSECALLCEIFVGNDFIHSYTTHACPGIPIVYVLYNLPPAVPCRVVWNGEIETEFMVSKRVRMMVEMNDDFPLVRYVRCNLGTHPTNIYGLTHAGSFHEKVVCISDVWGNLLTERPNIVIHTSTIECSKRMSINKAIDTRCVWRRIRDIYHASWSEASVRAIMATTSNVFVSNTKPFHHHHLIRLQRDELVSLIKSICDLSSHSGGIHLDYEDVVFLTTMIYREVLWRDIPYHFTGTYKHFLAGGKSYFILDTLHYRTNDTYLGSYQLAAIDNTLAYSQAGSHAVLIAQGDPFTRGYRSSGWGSKRKWRDELTRIIQNSSHHRITLVCGGNGECHEVAYYHSGMTIRGYIFSNGKRRIRKRFGDFKNVYMQSHPPGYMIIAYESVTIS